MNLLKFFRPHPEGGRYCSTKVNEIEALLTANGGVRTHAALPGSEYVYEWNCKGHKVIVNYRGSDWQGKAFAYLDVGLGEDMTAISNKDYDKELRAEGYVDSGLSGSRGDYFIDSYRPGAKKKHKLPPGRVEIHSWGKMFEIHTGFGKFTGDNALACVIKASKVTI